MAKASLLFVGTDDGIVLFSNPGGVGRWLRIGHELRGQQVRAVWPLADNPLVIFAVVVGAGVQRSDDGGQRWQAAADVEALVVVGHAQAPQTLYLGANDGRVYRSDDAGASWEPDAPLDVGGRTLAGLAVASEDPRQVYVGLGAAVWASDDGGAAWSRYGEDLPAPAMGLAAAPSQPGALYAVAAGALYRRVNAEGPWETVGAPPAAGPLAVLPGKAPVLVLALANGTIGRSEDDGATWAPTGAEPAWHGGVTTIVPAGYHIDTAFAGSGAGQIAISTDRARTWQIFKQELPPICCVAAARLM